MSYKSQKEEKNYQCHVYTCDSCYNKFCPGCDNIIDCVKCDKTLCNDCTLPYIDSVSKGTLQCVSKGTLPYIDSVSKGTLPYIDSVPTLPYIDSVHSGRFMCYECKNGFCYNCEEFFRVNDGDYCKPCAIKLNIDKYR